MVVERLSKESINVVDSAGMDKLHPLGQQLQKDFSAQVYVFHNEKGIRCVFRKGTLIPMGIFNLGGNVSVV